VRVLRLYHGSMDCVLGPDAPVFGYVILHPDGPVLVDTGIDEHRAAYPFPIKTRRIDHALADHGLAPSDITCVINTHFATDHCSQNDVFAGVPVVVQRTELERNGEDARAWFDVGGAKFELLDGDAVIRPGIRALFTPGHTPGHQSILVEDGGRTELIVGDAAYLATIWEDPELMTPGHVLWEGQIRTTRDQWRQSLERLRSLPADAIHLSHDAQIL
jgi:N-acyl homoserine lactone hydrolase